MAYREYWTLITRDSINDMWAPQFGSYDRSDVVAERDDYRDHGHKLVNMLIIVTGDRELDVMARVDALNAATKRRIEA